MPATSNIAVDYRKGSRKKISIKPQDNKSPQVPVMLKMGVFGLFSPTGW